MPDYTELLQVVKRAATEAVAAGKPSGIYFGKVVSTEPLQISVEQKMILGTAQLVLTRNVTDYETAITAEWETGETSGGSGEEAFEVHKHVISGIKLVTIHNGLSKGDEVILAQQQGGQKYIVLDKVG
ncbi:MAG: DUF2577 domain-containing protein [Clostridiales bacterium]|nr:DUF2577 domain-containing protein [Clostridiales bacterium]